MVIYREITTAEASIEIVVSSGVNKAVGKLRADFKRILSYIVEGTPKVAREETRAEGSSTTIPKTDLKLDTDSERESEWRRTYQRRSRVM